MISNYREEGHILTSNFKLTISLILLELSIVDLKYYIGILINLHKCIFSYLIKNFALIMTNDVVFIDPLHLKQKSRVFFNSHQFIGFAFFDYECLRIQQKISNFSFVMLPKKIYKIQSQFSSFRHLGLFINSRINSTQLVKRNRYLKNVLR